MSKDRASVKMRMISLPADTGQKPLAKETVPSLWANKVLDLA
ncbi:MAG: hypothetical protein WGN25_01265 [Candidatus Electrothrix sp. GW3-4]